VPRCSCPYAGTTRIRFEGLPRPTAASQPPDGAPLGRSDYLQSVPLPSRLRFNVWRKDPIWEIV